MFLSMSDSETAELELEETALSESSLSDTEQLQVAIFSTCKMSVMSVSLLS